MLGIPRENPNANASGLGTKKSKKEVKPKGMSREVWQIVRETNRAFLRAECKVFIRKEEEKIK